MILSTAILDLRAIPMERRYEVGYGDAYGDALFALQRNGWTWCIPTNMPAGIIVAVRVEGL